MCSQSTPNVPHTVAPVGRVGVSFFFSNKNAFGTDFEEKELRRDKKYMQWGRGSFRAFQIVSRNKNKGWGIPCNQLSYVEGI